MSILHQPPVRHEGGPRGDASAASTRTPAGSAPPESAGGAQAERRARVIAVHLPQFHPIPENDQWWGRGFTEWTNVARCRPLFPGHYQPHVPGHLGFYDLRLPEAREAQAELARRSGIEGFCYYHYWFSGKRLLEKPVDEILASGDPDFPFCLTWANETWSRRWLGEEKEILLKQCYSAEDDHRHARWLVRAFADPRYIRVNGRPLFLVYRPRDLPDPARTLDIIRTECVRHGLPDPYLVGVNAHTPQLDMRTLGFDGTFDFEPKLGVVPGIFDEGLKTFDYVEGRRKMHAERVSHPVHPCIFVGWDNTPRRGENGIVCTGSTPENFESGFREMVDSVQDEPFESRLVFINAWNEWAEGNHLEPDLKHGLAYLESVKRVSVGSPR